MKIEVKKTKAKIHNPTGMVSLVAVRRAVANYMFSEGCSCCEASDHDEHEAVVAKLLKVKKYDDNSGYNFSKYSTQ